jgi:hypothetical protein
MLITLLTMRSTAFGQPSSIDSVTISRDQQKQCIVWHKEGVVKDSIIVAKDSIIVVQREFIHYTDTLITDYDLKLKTSYNRLDKMKKKRRNAWIFGGVGTLGAFIFGFFLSP